MLEIGDKVKFRQGEKLVIGIIEKFRLNNKFADILIIDGYGYNGKRLITKIEQLEKIEID